MLAAVAWSAKYVVRRFRIPSRPWLRLRLGGLAFVFLVAAEVALAYTLQGLSPAEYISSRDSVSGPVYFASLVLFALMPLFVVRRSNPSLERP
jgi:succinate dehydrogenase hydrophobic anchor subunit